MAAHEVVQILSGVVNEAIDHDVAPRIVAFLDALWTSGFAFKEITEDRRPGGIHYF
jgi:hypothetical protein